MYRTLSAWVWMFVFVGVVFSTDSTNWQIITIGCEDRQNGGSNTLIQKRIDNIATKSWLFGLYWWYLVTTTDQANIGERSMVWNITFAWTACKSVVLKASGPQWCRRGLYGVFGIFFWSFDVYMWFVQYICLNFVNLYGQSRYIWHRFSLWDSFLGFASQFGYLTFHRLHGNVHQNV